jgi:hypothetical protein
VRSRAASLLYSKRCRWYNEPPSSETGTESGSKPHSYIHEKQEGLTMSLGHDSVPLNFTTFVPSHEPGSPNLAAANAQNLTGIAQDEAFRNALNAMYWTGYWTAVYHARFSFSYLPVSDPDLRVVAYQIRLCLKKWMMLALREMNLKLQTLVEPRTNL